MKIIRFVILICLILTLYGCVAQDVAREELPATKGNTTEHEKTLKINDINFRSKVYGQGGITVIFESGIALPIETWFSIDDSVAKFAKVFLYDRAGIGQSSLSSLPRTIPNYVIDLKSLLEREEIHPPYIFVAHSMGGYIARYYSWKYPKDVAGLLLIDPAPETMYDSLSEKELKDYLKRGDEYYSKKNHGSQLEWSALYSNRSFMYDIEIDNSIPVIVLSSSKGNMTKYHKQIFAQRPNTEIKEIDGGHFIHYEYPELIVEYIQKLLVNSR